MNGDRDLDAMYRLFTWRITSNHVPHWDFEQITREIGVWADWCGVWRHWARRHAGLGEAALDAGDDRGAGMHFIRAGLFLHWASFLFAHERDQFEAALSEMAAAWASAALLLDPPMELLEIPFDGVTLPAWLRRPPGDGRPPIAVLVPGADSTKEELFNLGEHILAQGIAVCAFDGPGHGAVAFERKLRPDFEVPIAAVIDHLSERDDVDTGRLAAVGISYGGMFACRAAAFDDRVRAAVSMSSWYTPAGRYPTMDPVSQSGLRFYMGEDAAAVQDSMTMEGAAERITVPLLQVYGGRDPASPPEHAYRVEAEARGETTTVVMPEGVHVCNNLWYEARPLVARWLSERL